MGKNKKKSQKQEQQSSGPSQPEQSGSSQPQQLHPAQNVGVTQQQSSQQGQMEQTPPAHLGAGLVEPASSEFPQLGGGGRGYTGRGRGRGGDHGDRGGRGADRGGRGADRGGRGADRGGRGADRGGRGADRGGRGADRGGRGGRGADRGGRGADRGRGWGRGSHFTQVGLQESAEGLPSRDRGSHGDSPTMDVPAASQPTLPKQQLQTFLQPQPELQIRSQEVRTSDDSNGTRGASAGRGRGWGRGNPLARGGLQELAEGLPSGDRSSHGYSPTMEVPAASQPTLPEQQLQTFVQPQTELQIHTPEIRTSQKSDDSRGPRGSFRIPTRPRIDQAGVKGRHTTVRTNHLELNLHRLSTKIAYHYDVSIDPDKPKRLLRSAVELFRVKHFRDRYPAFDGRRNMYSARPLPFDHKSEFVDTIKVRDEERQKDKEFKIAIKFATEVDLTSLSNYMKSGTSLEAPQQAIQVIDVVLRCAPALQFVPVGRSYFTPPSGTVEPLGDGYEIWYGLFQSVNLGWQPFVNVDVVHKGFPQSQPVTNAIEEICGNYKNPVDLTRSLREYQLGDLKKFLIGLKIDYMIPGNPSTKRTYKVNNVVDPPSQIWFDLDNGKKITVQQYFEREKKIQLRYKSLPCLHVGSLNRPNPIYVPLEFCTITAGQVVQKRLNEKQTSNMIKKAATSTQIREKKIKNALSKAQFNYSPQVREFGLQVNENFKEIKARVLNPPQLEYRPRDGPVTPNRGVWQAKPFMDGKKLEKWVVLSLDNYISDDVIRSFVTQFQSQGQKLGMIINQPYPTKKIDPRKIKFDLESFMRETASQKLELIVVVVQEKGNDYAFVKQTAELRLGILTQCVKSSTMQRKMNYATAQNILLKVNSKLNGINHSMHTLSRPSIFSVPIMIVGADVTHPSPDETKIPSVAAVCASHDPKAFQYNTQFRIQPARVEIIQDLEAIMIHHLRFFREKTNYPPQRILFYRDGVSEGQFQQVLNSELRAIRSACTKLNENYKPSITFVVVQKRHHTRFFPIHQEDSDGKNCNVMPGTIVDTTITHPTERDFYLVSHASIQGVSRPTKYHCLWDDNKLTEDEMEELTYYLCHLFSRCTRSVSYPAPTYYAHLAAYRARVYLSGQNLTAERLSSDIQNRLQTDLLGKLQMQRPMYFV